MNSPSARLAAGVGGQAPPSLSLAQWAVLGLLVERPRHGFALAGEIAAGSPLGQVWKLPRPLVYRAVSALELAGLAERAGIEVTGAAPQRTLLRPTGAGRRELRRWLDRPVEHLRDLRSELLVKLYFHDRLGSDATALLRAQSRMLARLVASISEPTGPGSPRSTGPAYGTGFEQVLADWRLHSARAASEFVTAQLARRAGTSGAPERD